MRLNESLKRSIYNDIMLDVAKTIKQKLNEDFSDIDNNEYDVNKPIHIQQCHGYVNDSNAVRHYYISKFDVSAPGYDVYYFAIAPEYSDTIYCGRIIDWRRYREVKNCTKTSFLLKAFPKAFVGKKVDVITNLYEKDEQIIEDFCEELREKRIPIKLDTDVFEEASIKENSNF